MRETVMPNGNMPGSERSRNFSSAEKRHLREVAMCSLKIRKEEEGYGG